MSSLKMTFSLASLVLILGLVFAIAGDGAGCGGSVGNGVTIDALATAERSRGRRWHVLGLLVGRPYRTLPT